MKLGDFTKLARHYHHRAGYSRSVLSNLIRWTGVEKGALVADIGAGTGKLAGVLLEFEIEIVCVEPNDAMRAEGERATRGTGTRWLAGSAEKIPLEDGLVPWALMGSSFHWTDPSRSLPELHRILQPGGHFTAIWNPRRIEGNEFHERVERRIYEVVPELKRVSSGGSRYTEHMFEVLCSTGHFEDVISVVGRHELRISPERYRGAWLSVNDIQAQAGPQRWARILDVIDEEVDGLDEVVTPYESRSFTARRVDSA